MARQGRPAECGQVWQPFVAGICDEVSYDPAKIIIDDYEDRLMIRAGDA
jgi:hypothetical protein